MCSVPVHLDLHHPNILSSFGVIEQIQIFVKNKYKKSTFQAQNRELTEKTWHHMKE